MMTKPHPHQEQGTYYSFNYCTSSLCTKVVAQQSDKRKDITNKSTLFKNYYDKTTLK
jgi:hypothetical protein